MKSHHRFLISALPVEPFRFLFGLSDTELAAHNARRCIADMKPGYPCRVSLVEAELGESVILVPYTHHAVNGPYHGTGPVYIREGATRVELDVNQIPEVARGRLMSVRAYDSEGLMIASDVVEGRDLESSIEYFFTQENIAYLHLHNAKPGCYSCRVDRVQ
jgi:hypothetical protein